MGAIRKLTTVPAKSTQDEIWSIIDRDGGVILADFLAPRTLKGLNEELAGFIAACTPGSKAGQQQWIEFHGARTKRFCGLAAKSRSFIDVLCDPRMKAYGDRYLSPNSASHILNTSQMMAVGPDEPAQMLHRDKDNWPQFPWPPPEVTVSTMFALNDFTEENGATQVVPGSHKWKSETRVANPEEIAQAVMRAGSVLFYTGKTLHGAGANRTKDQERIGMHVSWVVGWLQPEENSFLAVPPEVAYALPARAQQVLGYTAYYAQGYGGRLRLVDFEDPARTPEARQLAEGGSKWTWDRAADERLLLRS